MRNGARNSYFLFIFVLLVAGCLRKLGFTGPRPADDGTFTGTWVANGHKEVLSFGSDRETSLFRLSGVVHLTNKIGKESDYWAEGIGLADSETGSDIRCVWRSMDGDEIYLIMKGTMMEKGSSVTGNIIGGTGAAKGITGTLPPSPGP